MKWDKGDTHIMARIVPGTTIRIRPPWQKAPVKRASTGPLRPVRPGATTLRLVETSPREEAPVETPKVPDDKDKA